jgi:hypothetical protein
MSSEDTKINTTDIEDLGSGSRIEPPGIVVTKPPILTPPAKLPSKEPSIVLPSTEETNQAPLNKNHVNLNTCDMLSDIEKAKELNMMVTGINPGTDACPELPISTTITQTADLLRNINSIKDELCKLPLDTCESEYINNDVNPLLNVLNQLANISANLAVSVNYLTISPVVHPKKSELKDTIHLIYDINEECEDVFDVLQHRIKRVLKD